MACHVRTGCSHAPKGTAVSQAAPLPPVMRSRALPSRGGPGGGTKRLPETIRHTNGAKSLPRTAPCPCRQQFAPQTSVAPQGHGQQGPGSTRGLGSGGSLSATPPSCRPPLPPHLLGWNQQPGGWSHRHPQGLEGRGPPSFCNTPETLTIPGGLRKLSRPDSI